MRTVMTRWEIWTYDVWGNDEDGYEVNDRSHDYDGDLELEVKVANPGYPMAFEYADLIDQQIRELCQIDPAVEIETYGDDVVVYINDASNGRPVGEMVCISHESLSPPRPAKDFTPPPEWSEAEPVPAGWDKVETEVGNE